MQSCPQNIAEPLLEILQTGLLAIRATGFAGQADACAVHADHLHNLPSLIEDYSEDRLLYYWQVERASFVAAMGSRERSIFDVPWSRLESIIAELEVHSKKPTEVAGTV